MPQKPRLLYNLSDLLISEEFKAITGFDLLPRKTNYFFGRIQREDCVFSGLAVLYFSEPEKFRKLQNSIRRWLQKDNSETMLALAGYIYYIVGEFKKAQACFLTAISRNPDNLDNWLDLAFVLRHTGDHRTSSGILFNYDYIIYYYKYLKLQACSYRDIKKLVKEITIHADVK